MWTYGSWKHDIRFHADLLLEMAERQLVDFDQVHFVVHSMGSIVLRAALAKRPFKNLGRTVFLGPPHRGTPMADKFCGWWGQNWRTVADLKAGEDSFVNQLPAWSYGPACVIRAQGDFLIPEDRVQLDGITQYACVPGPHSYLLFSAKAAKLAIGFIETGNLGYDNTGT